MSAHECGQECVDNPMCTHWTWTTFYSSDGDCFLKHASPSISSTPCDICVCGVVADSPEFTQTPIRNDDPQQSDDCAASYQSAMLDAHNEYRYKHGVPALITSQQAMDLAQSWASHLASTDTFEHGGCTNCGQNIAAGSNNPDCAGKRLVAFSFSIILLKILMYFSFRLLI